MGRKETNPVHKLFKYEHNLDNAICTICTAKLKGKHGGNLQRHFKWMHPDELKDFLNKHNNTQEKSLGKKQLVLEDVMSPISTKVKLTRNMLENACIELVTVNGRPFSLLNDSGFRKIVGPLVEGLSKRHQEGSFLSTDSIRSKIHEHALMLRNNIKKEVSQKIISVKLDACTRQDRSFLGINIQYIKNGKITLNTLGLKELIQPQTGKYLQGIIIGVLYEYGIKPEQIYTVTTDNGSNMIKAVKLLAEVDVLSENENDNREDNSLDEESNVEDDINLELLNSCATNISRITTVGIRCAAHTLQLAVLDALSTEQKSKNIINKAREVAKILRTKAYVREIKKQDLKKPIVDCTTRWSSTHDMLYRLLELKEFINVEARSNSKLYLVENEWSNISSICKALFPAKIATKRLETEQLTLSDFYGIWKSCVLHTQKIKSNFSSVLVTKLNERESQLINNDVLLSSVFLDPRYSILLTEDQAERAVPHLVTLYNCIIKLENLPLVNNNNNNISTDAPSCSTSIIVDDSTSDLEMDTLLEQRERLLASKANTCGVKDVKEHRIQRILKNYYSNHKRIDRKENILEIWQSKKQSQPELYVLAMTVLAVPATEVSVERLFSGLKYILSPLRYNIKSPAVEDVLLLRCNSIFQNKNFGNQLSGGKRKKSDEEIAEETAGPSKRDTSKIGTQQQTTLVEFCTATNKNDEEESDSDSDLSLLDLRRKYN